MAKVVYTAYDKINQATSEYKPISDSIAPYTSSAGWIRLPYLQQGITITKGGDVTLYSCEEINSAILPDGSASRIGKNFVNAADTKILNGGKLYIAAGAVASNTVISGAGSIENVSWDWQFTQDDDQTEPAVRAESLNANVHSGGTQSVKGGYTGGTTIHDGGTQIIAGGKVTKWKRDEAGMRYLYSSLADGIAQDTEVLSGGKLIVNNQGCIYDARVNGGTLTLNNNSYAIDTVVNSGQITIGGGAYAENLTIAQDVNFSVINGATLSGYLLTSQPFNIGYLTDTEKLNFCFDLSRMTDKNVTVLNDDMYNNVDKNTTFSVYASSDNVSETTTTYTIMNIGETFDRAITILNIDEDIAGDKYFSKGNQLLLNTEVYDMFGNSYVLKYDDKSHTYTVDFTVNVKFDYLEFGKSSKKDECTLELDGGEHYGLYSVQLKIYDPDETLSKEERLSIFKSLNGTVKIYKNGSLAGTQTIQNGVVISSKTLIPPAEAGDIVYNVSLSSNAAIDKDYTIKVSATNTAINNTDAEDNVWQALPRESTVYAQKQYIYDINDSDSFTFDSEYIGYKDNVDYRRLDISDSGYLNISLACRSLNNANGQISVTIYEATNDGSTVKKAVSVNKTVKNTLISLPTVIVGAGTYYIEIKANDKSFIDYSCNISTDIFNMPEASVNDNTPEKAAFFFADKKLNLEESATDWVGPGDTVDYKQLNISAPGKYTVTLDKIDNKDLSNESNLKLEVVCIDDGKQKVLYSQSIKTNVNQQISKEIFIDPVDGAQYFARVTNTNAAKGNDIYYKLTFNGESFSAADNSDDTPETAQQTTVGEDNYIIKNNYLGYADVTDYYKFDITESGEYSFTLESSLKAGAKITVYRLYDDGKIGTVPLQSVISSGSPTSFKGTAYSTQTKYVQMFEGTYYVKVTGGNKANDSKNTDYSVKLSGSAYEELASAKNIEKGKTYSVTIDDYTTLSSELYRKITLTQDNGKNKTTKITLSQETILAKGTYYFTASADMSAADISFAASEKYADAVVTNNNSWKNADTIGAEGVSNQWVGYGDGIDYYKYTVTADNAGKNVITFDPYYVKNAAITLYRVNTDAKGVQNLVKASYKFKDNVITADNLIAGDYYIAVDSKNYTTESKALNTSYNIDIETEAYQKLSSDITNKTVLEKNEYAVVNIGKEGTFYASFKGEKYTLYKDNGKGGLTAVNTYDNSVMLDGNSVYYVKSSAANNKIAFTSTAVEDNQHDTPNSRWHLGLNDASDSYEFDTFGEQGGMALFTLENISDTVSANTKFTVTLYQEVNGAWKKVSSANATYNAKTYKETAAKLAVSLEADSKYKVEVSTSDNGAGQCAGYFDFKETDFDYNYDNNMFQQATELKNHMNAVVTKKGDTVDFYELDNSKAFSIELNTDIDAKAAVKLTFYDENYKVVKFNNNGKTLSNLTLNAKDNDFDMASISEDIKFARIDAVGSDINYYTISDSID